MIENNELKEVIRNDLPGRFCELDFLKRNWSRILNIFDGNILPPYEILIHPSSICNLYCKWCIGNHVANKQNKDELVDNNLNDLENMKKVVYGILNYKKIGKNYENNRNQEFKVENVSFSGITGEPMVSKEAILYAIDKLSNNGLRVGMFTNGTLLTEETHSTILKMAYVLISIDAGNESTYSKLKCAGKKLKMLNNVFNNIKSLSDKKKIYNSDLDINVGYIINQYNYNEIYELAKKLKGLGVHYFRIKTDIASEMLMNEIQVEEARKQIERVKELLNDEEFEIVEIHRLGDEKQKKRNFDKCFIHYLMGAISADGKVYPCNYHPKKNGYFYDSAIDKDFGKIWDNLMKYEIDTKIPNICPDRCDPFKNRTNKMLEVAYKIYKEKGIEYLKECMDEIEYEQ